MKLSCKIFLIYFTVQYFSILCVRSERTDRILSRKRRFLAFPEGSSFSVAICTAMGQIGTPAANHISYAMNWGVAYDLPNNTWVVHSANGFKQQPDNDEDYPIFRRRYRKDLYGKVELLLDRMGHNGRDCIMRALCESKKFFAGRLGTMEEEILKKIFSLRLNELSAHGHSDDYEYSKAYHKHSSYDDCSLVYSKCGFSLIALAFGKHSASSTN